MATYDLHSPKDGDYDKARKILQALDFSSVGAGNTGRIIFLPNTTMLAHVDMHIELTAEQVCGFIREDFAKAGLPLSRLLVVKAFEWFSFGPEFVPDRASK